MSRPAYGQLQKLKGKSLDVADTPEKKYPEPKANRLLLLELTDGVVDFQAMEYQPVTQLNTQHLLPGTKVLVTALSTLTTYTQYDALTILAVGDPG